MSSCQSAERLTPDRDTERGCPFSVGRASTTVVAQRASTGQKPSGLAAMPGRARPRSLAPLPVAHGWGRGPQPTALLHTHGVQTAWPCAPPSEAGVQTAGSPPFSQIWQALHGADSCALVTGAQVPAHTIQHGPTCTPPSSHRALVCAPLATHLEHACLT
jgi:nucleotidyltransferase/DNA polymerase involved in DNA repair